MLKYGITSRIEKETELILEKTFQAPREKVFKMFTETEHLEQFWGPRKWQLIYSKMDFRPGGEWLYGMQSFDDIHQTIGMESWGKMIFQEIEPPHRLVYADYFTDKNGEINHEMPVAETTIEFLELDAERTFVVSRTRYASADELQALLENGMLEGIAETWDRLSAYLK